MNVERLLDNPILVPDMDGRMGSNINGPSLVRAPSWVERPLGRYYLYFGHHQGTYIRLAYADAVEGPWRTHEAGVLELADSYFRGHIASPDVVVDEGRREVRLYYHGVLREEDRSLPLARHGAQATRVALSGDGLHFEARPEVLGTSYMRVFQWRGRHYGLAMPGVFYRSADGLSGFEEGPLPFPERMRHAGLLLRGNTLWVFYSRWGDCPEHVLVSRIELSDDWLAWRPTSPESVLRPEREWEGATCAQVASKSGAIHEPAYQLRDPYVFEEGTQRYLLYSVAGERGIGVARLAL